MKPTPQQVKAELATLRELRGKIPPRNAFGGDNLAKIDAEIDVLDHLLSDKQIITQYGVDETAEEFSDNDIEVYEAAEYAREWLDGETTDGSMSDNWRPLAGVKVKRL